MNQIAQNPRQPMSDRRLPASQFLFSGRGPLRRAQIEVLCRRSGLRMTAWRLSGWENSKRG